ncbi:MAG: hypothetical protein ACO37W_11645, partial [Prochlorotrichaceae cyanobacterium]
MTNTLPLPPHFAANRVGEVWRVPYQDRADQAKAWAKQHSIAPAAKDKTRICLMAIDPTEMLTLPKDVRARLDERFPMTLEEAGVSISDRGDT